MKPGERVVHRTKESIKSALLQLVKEKNYSDITIIDIVITADIGRSTLYKHYQSKAHIMLDIHQEMFNRLLNDLSNEENWLSTEPQPNLVSFLNMSRQSGNSRFFMSYKLGNDLDFLLSNINAILNDAILEHLNKAFANTKFDIPIKIIAISVASIYKELLLAWFTKFPNVSANEYAGYISQIRRQLILSHSNVSA